MIGAGSAGAIVAARLSENPKRRILLLEAGGSADQLRFRIPSLGAMKARGDPACDWLFKTEPDPTRLERVDMSFRGKVLGGSSALNGSIYVRGNRGDYDGWAQSGNTGWDYDSLLPYFRQLEQGVGVLSGAYGDKGPIHISQAAGIPPLAKTFLKGMAELGVPGNASYNGEEQHGAAISHVNQHRGLRESTANTYLRVAAKRPNLTILTGATVRRLLFDGRRAIGVEFNHEGELRREYAGNDIILSASVFNTPKLLMLSGIGDPAHLARQGIAVLHGNPAVGRNLQDHPAVAVKAFVKGRTTNMDMNLLGQAKIAAQWALTRGGPATWMFPAIAFAKSRQDLAYPDLQFHFGAMIVDVTERGLTWPDRPGVTILVNACRPSSRGTVELRSADPLDPPKIQSNLLADREDAEVLKRGVGLARALWQTKAFAPYFQAEHWLNGEPVGEALLDKFVRSDASGAYHACGTARMGVDEHAVVDPRLHVIGVENLRVIDCSIIPQMPSGNINAISMAIGEKGAAMIKEDLR